MLVHDTPLRLCVCGCGLPVGKARARARPGHNPRLEPEQRFWTRVLIIEDPDACWVWQRCTAGGGYGSFRIRKRHIPAHRYAYSLRAPLSDDATILHTCDNRGYVRNDEQGTYEVAGKILPRWGHLVLGTQDDNIQDAMIKGRIPHPGPTNPPHSEQHCHAKLTNADVRAMRAAYAAGVSQPTLAARYGVVQTTVSRIVRRERWTHI